MKIHIDCETRSRVDIWESGAYVYASDPTTELMCVAYAVGNGPVKIIPWKAIQMYPLMDPFEELRTLAADKNNLFCAHSALFEQLIFQFKLHAAFDMPRLPINRWRCTAAKALAHNLPKSLADVAVALGTTNKKDIGGRAVMLKLCKPKSDGTWEEDEDLVAQLENYCAQDVKTERDIDNLLPELSPAEQTVWFEDQLINQRGIAVDREALDKCLALIAEETELLTKEIGRLTGGELDGVSRRQAVLDYFAKKGVKLPDFTKATVQTALDSGKIPPELTAVLRIRQQLGLTSTAKYEALKQAICEDNRLRDTLVYHGSGTGRWCMPGSAEILTPKGWEQLSKWGGGSILAWHNGGLFWDGTGVNNSFDHFGHMVEINHRFLKGIFTEEHKFPVMNNGEYRVKYARQLASGDLLFLNGRKESTVPSIRTRIWVMIQADGNVRTDKTQGREIRFGFRKERKIKRCTTLLRSAGIPFSIKKYQNDTRIKIKWADAPEWVKEKHFNASVLEHDPKIFLDELKFWDSHIEKKNNNGGFEYVSTCFEDAEWAATMAHLAGCSATIATRKRRNIKWSTSYRVYIRRQKHFQIRKKDIGHRYFDGKVFCPTTRSGYFLCRYNGSIFISGNSGKTVQIQNLPKGTIEDTTTACELIKDMDYGALKMMYGNIMGLLSSCLRGMFVSSPGHSLVVADYNAIEARVLMWFSGQDDAVKMFRDGVDVYVEMAKRIGGGASRQLGKQVVLGCGYGCGSDKFRDTCRGYGIAITDELAERAVGSYRSSYRNVVSMWYEQERAMKAAIETKNPIVCGKVKWEYKGAFLYCYLPSGRALAYHKARIEGGKIKYMSTNSMTKHYGWTDTYSSRIVENICQAIARDILAYAMVNAERRGFPIVLTVHDELVAEVPSREAYVENFIKVITELPAWAAGCPITAEGWVGERYKKG